jgi:hypothetical protein
MTAADRTLIWLAALVLPLVFAASACGGGDGPALEPVTPTATASPTGSATAVPTALPTAVSTPADLVVLPTPAPVTGVDAFTSASKLSTGGLSPIFFGDTIADAASKAGTSWIGPADGSKPHCYTVQADGEPRGLYFTVLDGRIERVDVTTPIITTPSGAGVGTSQSELETLFGERLQITTVASGQDFAYVPASAADQKFRIVWTVEGSTVVSMRAGRIPFVQPTSPCS